MPAIARLAVPFLLILLAFAVAVIAAKYGTHPAAMHFHGHPAGRLAGGDMHYHG